MPMHAMRNRHVVTNERDALRPEMRDQIGQLKPAVAAPSDMRRGL